MTTQTRTTRRTVLFATAGLALASLVLSLVAAASLVPGLPYDEPAHWSNVQYLLRASSLPVLGDPGVGYEAQQTPGFYVMAAIVAGLAGESAFVAVRMLSAVGQGILVALTALILWPVTRRNVLATIAGAAFIALNPMLIVMSGSVQNDTWALVWGFAAIALAVRSTRMPRWLHAALVGVLVALAVLTKLSLAPLLLGLVFAWLLRRRVLEPLVAVATVAVLTGWWFVRNLVLYGDLTGQSAVALTGAEFQNEPLGPLALARTVLTYLTVPTEYLRNTIQAPVWVDAAAAAVGLVLVVGIVAICLRWRRAYAAWPLTAVAAVAVVSVVAWLVQVQFGWPVAFRTAYAALPFFALAAGAAVTLPRARWAGWTVLGVTSALQLAVLAWTAVTVSSLALTSLL